MRRFFLALQTRTWRQHIGHVLGGSWLFLIALVFVRDAHLRQQLKFILLGLILFAFAAKETADAPDNWGRARAVYRERRSFWLAVWVAIPEEIRGWGRTFLALQLAFLRKTLGPSSKTEERPAGFTYLQRSGYTSFMPILVISSIVDIPLAHLAIGYTSLPANTQLCLHAFIVLVHVFAFSTLIGDRFLLGPGQHEVTSTDLLISLGARATGTIPLDAILSATKLTRPLKPKSVSTQDVVVSPCSRPNVALALREGGSELTVLGASVRNVRTIYLYVDRPEEFIKRVRNPEGQVSHFPKKAQSAIWET
jgi:hypothetical protein